VHVRTYKRGCSIPGYWLGECHPGLDALPEAVHDPEVDYQAGEEGQDELNDEHHEADMGEGLSASCISFFPLYIFRAFLWFVVPLPPHKGQPMVVSHPSRQPIKVLTKIAVG
jgi:hypothetical protein